MTRTWIPDTDTTKPDKTDFRTVKAWLNRYREAEKRYYLLSDRLAEAQEGHPAHYPEPQRGPRRQQRWPEPCPGGGTRGGSGAPRL